jgi:hypothetical protein
MDQAKVTPVRAPAASRGETSHPECPVCSTLCPQRHTDNLADIWRQVYEECHDLIFDAAVRQELGNGLRESIAVLRAGRAANSQASEFADAYLRRFGIHCRRVHEQGRRLGREGMWARNPDIPPGINFRSFLH